MRLALAQISSVPGDFGAIGEAMLTMARRAASSGADLVLFPLTLMAGVYPRGLCESSSFAMAMMDVIEDFASRTPVDAIVPMPLFNEANPRTQLVLCSQGLPSPLGLRAGQVIGARVDAPNAIATLMYQGIQFEFVVADAMWGLHDPASGDAPDVTVLMSPWAFCDDDSATIGIAGAADSMLGQLTGEDPRWFVLMQGVGGYDDSVLAGGSCAIAPDGTVAAAAALFEDDLVAFDIKLGGQEGAAAVGFLGREGVSPALMAQPEDIVAGQDQDGWDFGVQGVEGTCIGSKVVDLPSLTDADSCGLLWRALVRATRDYVNGSGFRDVILGLSGGIDSAVVASVAVDALGPEHVHGVLMPGPYSSADSVTDALELASNLGVATTKVPIGDAYACFGSMMADALGAPLAGLADQNVQARLRGVVLMTMSNVMGALVLNTGNKSESGMGYSTLYGDTVGAFAPLADVYKTRVYELAGWRNSCGPLPVIPAAILTKAPSAELAPGQTDEVSMGATYAEIDGILMRYVDRGMTAAQVVADGFEPDLVERVIRTCENNEYKRRQEPLGPIVSLKSFVEREHPIVCAWRDRPSADDGAQDGPRAVRVMCQVDQETLDDMDMDELEAQIMEQVSQTLQDVLTDPVAERLEAWAKAAGREDEVRGIMQDVTFAALDELAQNLQQGPSGFPFFSRN